MTSVDDLTWSQLRPQRVVPPCVLESIPIEDMKSFLHIIATNPTLPFYESSAVCSKIQSYRKWRCENANLNAVSKPFSILSSLKRTKREQRTTNETEPVEIDDSDSENERPKRKQRRSARPASTEATFSINNNMSRGAPPKIGPDCQAVVPTAPLSKEYWQNNPPKIESQLIFSSKRVKGDANLEKYLGSVNSSMRRRDGFPLAPFALELALEQLMKAEGDINKAIRNSLSRIPKGPYFPGIKKPFTYEEQCLFVRTLAEREKNFFYMSNHILTDREVSELTWMYYTRHKQFWLQNGGLKSGLVLDDGGEKLKRISLTTSRTLNALQRLAITAGDGFPIDNRVQSALMACRRGCVSREKKRRE